MGENAGTKPPTTEYGKMSLKMRSLLAVPAVRQEFFAKAAASATDALFLDLEDSVPPSQKLAARSNAA